MMVPEDVDRIVEAHWKKPIDVEAVRKDEIRRTIRCALITAAILGIAFSIAAVIEAIRLYPL